MHCADTRDLQRCGRQAVQIQVDLAAYICIYTYTDTFDVCHSINIVAYNGCYHLLLVLLSLTDFFPHYLSLSSSFTTRVYASTNMHACMIFFLVLALLPLHLYVCTCVLDFSSRHFFFRFLLYSGTSSSNFALQEMCRRRASSLLHLVTSFYRDN